ncbi:hypothetical protein, partial [Mycoplasma tauri]|uniref:hypothetical protein n=1 Tax=Mycoplasma tauri TaxID=547987 RepID=UPI004037AA4E|nr:hypothetical protein [Mycoplasma tauri]
NGYKRHWSIFINKNCFKTLNQYEQQKISSLFLNLNTSITLHQRKLEKLKNIKNMLLEKAFI